MMNKTVRNIGLMAIAAGILYYPLLRVYRRLIAAGRNKENARTNHTEHHIYKMFAPAYRGALKPHRRK